MAITKTDHDQVKCKCGGDTVYLDSDGPKHNYSCRSCGKRVLVDPKPVEKKEPAPKKAEAK